MLDVLGRRRGLTAGCSVIAVDAPGKLPADVRERVAGELGRTASRAFGSDMTAVWRERAAGDWFGRLTRLFLIVGPDDAVGGWTSYRRGDPGGHRCLYMDSTGVVPELQRHGLIPAVQARAFRNELVRSPVRGLYALYRTRNPVVYRGLRRALGPRRLAPPVGGTAAPKVQRLGDAAHAWIGDAGEFDPATLIARGVYARGGPLYGEGQEPRSGDPAIDDLFERALGPEDAFLLVVRVSAPALLAAPLRRTARRLAALGSERPGRPASGPR